MQSHRPCAGHRSCTACRAGARWKDEFGNPAQTSHPHISLDWARSGEVSTIFPSARLSGNVADEGCRQPSARARPGFHRLLVRANSRCSGTNEKVQDRAFGGILGAWQARRMGFASLYAILRKPCAPSVMRTPMKIPAKRLEQRKRPSRRPNAVVAPGTSGMDAARGAPGHGWPIAPAPRATTEGTDAVGPDDGQPFWFLLGRLPKKLARGETRNISKTRQSARPEPPATLAILL